jgi:hypothetical protein
MPHYIPSRKYRYEIANLIKEGNTIEQAENEIFKGNSNKSKYLKYYKREGLFPYGKVDKPIEITIPSAFGSKTLVDVHSDGRGGLG